MFTAVPHLTRPSFRILGFHSSRSKKGHFFRLRLLFPLRFFNIVNPFNSHPIKCFARLNFLLYRHHRLVRSLSQYIKSTLTCF